MESHLYLYPAQGNCFGPYKITNINPITGDQLDKYAFVYLCTKTSVNEYHSIMRNFEYVFIDRSHEKPFELTKNVSVLIFCYNNYFNQKLCLTKVMICVYFGHSFNQQFKLSKAIQTLKLNLWFDKHIVLSKQLKKLFLEKSNFNHPIILSKQLETVYFGYNFNQKLVLSKTIKNLSLNFCYDQHLILTKGLITLAVSGSYCHKMILDSCTNIKKLKILSFDNYFVLDNISDSVEIIDCNNSSLVVPWNLPNKFYIILYPSTGVRYSIPFYVIHRYPKTQYIDTNGTNSMQLAKRKFSTFSKDYFKYS